MFQLVHPATFLSFSTVLRQVVLGLPLARFPSGCHPNAVIQSLPSYLLSICPIQFHLLLLISQLMLFVYAILCISSLLIRCCHLTLKILLMHLFWNVLSWCSSFFVIFQVSHPYKSTGLTSVLKRCNLVFLPIPLQHHILCSRWNAPLAFCNLCWISLFPPPSLSMMAPKYTNWSTSSTSSLPIRMLSSLLVLLVRRVLHFLALSFRPTLSDSLWIHIRPFHKNRLIDFWHLVEMKHSWSPSSVVVFDVI